MAGASLIFYVSASSTRRVEIQEPLLRKPTISSSKARKNRFHGPIIVRRSGSTKGIEEDGQDRQALLAKIRGEEVLRLVHAFGERYPVVKIARELDVSLEGFYNARGRHSALLVHLSPSECEESNLRGGTA